jgi:peptide/nickel transport system substrate-binding protein
MRNRFPVACALAACAFAFAADAATAIRVAANAEIRSTNPGVNRDANTDGVMLHIVEGLVGYKDDGTPAPLLAQSINISKDGKTYTFKLRPGVKFHNGAPWSGRGSATSIPPPSGCACRSSTARRASRSRASRPPIP